MTKTQQSETALRESQHVLETILNAIPARVFWKDDSLVFLGCNEAFAGDAGFAHAQEVIGKDDFQMVWREQAEKYRSDDREVIESGRAKSLIEETQTTATGETVTLLTNKVPLFDSDGKVQGLLGTYIDITERKRADEALRASEERYRRLFESAKDGILILDSTTAEIVDVNPFVCELLALSREEILGRKIWEMGPFRDVPASVINFRELQQLGYIRYEDLPLETADGREIAVEFVSNVYRVLDGEVIQCNIRDITQRKESAAENARLILAVEQAAESILITDPQGTIVYVNPAFERISGWTSEEALGKTPRILKSGQQDAAFYRAMWETLVRGEVWTGRLVNRATDGSIFEEEATISPLRDAFGRIVNYVASKRDITSERRLERQLFQAQKLEAIGRLAAGIAHDFNNLLGVILGYGQIVSSGLADSDPLLEDVDQILKAAERAADSTRQLLAFGRQQVLQPKLVDLNAIVVDSEKFMPRLLGEDIELVTQLAPGSGSVLADPGQLNQVLMNLVLNARDALPEGGRITLETSFVDLDATFAASHELTQPGPYVVLTVADTGVGMDEATKARAFEPFFTTKASGEGTGLGLAAAHGIINQSGGNILVDSEVGVGTTFKVYLPRVIEKLPAQGVATGPVPVLRGAETVLLVEDEAALRAMIRRILTANGYSVLVARDGSEALEIAASHPEPIQLLVSDVIMPGLTGPQLAKVLAADRPAMRVLFISGYSGEAAFQRGVLAEGSAFLSKPFRLQELLRHVRELLDTV